jgi:hypothetical protein
LEEEDEDLPPLHIEEAQSDEEEVVEKQRDGLAVSTSTEAVEGGAVSAKTEGIVGDDEEAVTDRPSSSTSVKPEPKSRAIISQEETDDAVATLLGAFGSGGNGDGFHEGTDEPGLGSQRPSSPNEADEEAVKAVASLAPQKRQHGSAAAVASEEEHGPSASTKCESVSKPGELSPLAESVTEGIASPRSSTANVPTTPASCQKVETNNNVRQALGISDKSATEDVMTLSTEELGDGGSTAWPQPSHVSLGGNEDECAAAVASVSYQEKSESVLVPSQVEQLAFSPLPVDKSADIEDALHR